MTLHPEIEGMKYLDWFRLLLVAFKQSGVEFTTLAQIAQSGNFGVAELVQAEIDGRSGKLAYQQCA